MLDKIFKSYDVRGIYPATINEDIAEKIGLAFVNQFNLKKVAIGCDGRISTPQLEKALTSGISSAGANVVHLGIVSTDMIYFASGFYNDIDGAIMITASHNPSDNNGFKFILKGAQAVSGEEGLTQMKKLIINKQLQKAQIQGKEENRKIYDDYTRKLLSLIDILKIQPLRVVVDAGNGVAGFIMRKLYKNLPLKIIPLYFEIDGNFPNHEPNPIEEENLADLKKKVLTEKADLGMAFDGDGDRIFLVNEKGEAVSATLMTAMIAKRLLEVNPGTRILYNLICGWIVPETIQKYGGIPSVTKVGHSLIKAQMRREDGLFAGEHSGHYFFKELYYADSGMLASLIVLEILSEQKKPLSKVTKEFDKYYLSGEINTEVSDQQAKINLIKQKYSDGKQSELDGISVEYPSWRFNVRPSNTEPVIRLNVEAKTRKLLEQKRDELVTLIRK